MLYTGDEFSSIALLYTSTLYVRTVDSTIATATAVVCVLLYTYNLPVHRVVYAPALQECVFAVDISPPQPTSSKRMVNLALAFLDGNI